jgi:long-chain acyl-CoA synthetase
MRTYWEDAERTNEAFMDGWLRTGDVGHADEDGYLYLHGRNADLINVGGRKVSPTEVEEVLRSHPAVLDCGCTGISDPAGVSGEAVAVLVLLRKGQESSKRELRVFLRGRLEPYKLPIKWSFSGVLPRTVNGKLQRHLLREQLETQGD